MKSIVCSVTLIYLCLENAAGWESSVRNQFFYCFSAEKTDHQWYHVYPNGSRQQPIYIGNIPKQTNVKLTYFLIKLENFDNNTEIRVYSYYDYGRNVKTIIAQYWFVDYIAEKFFSHLGPQPELPSTSPSTFVYIFLIKIGSNETLKDNKEPALLKYDETQKVSFKCQEYKDKTNLVIGVINTTTNTIKTYNQTFPDTIFNKSQNGAVLCCMYYEVTGTAEKMWITRIVAKKTVLVYDETVTVPVTNRQNSFEKNDLNSSSSTGDNAKNQGKQGTVSGKQDTDSGKKDANSGNQATIIYIVSAVAVGFILLVGTVIYLKRCSKKPKVEVETKVLYADLDFLRRNEPENLPREGPEEESPYAQIIGEFRPQ